MTVDLQEIVSAFEHHVAAQTDAIWMGDSKTGNKHARLYIEAFRKLRAFGDAGREALMPTLKHARPDVRVMAAAFLLRHNTEAARAVLETAASVKGLVGFGAAQALKGWDKGSWALDPPEG